MASSDLYDTCRRNSASQKLETGQMTKLASSFAKDARSNALQARAGEFLTEDEMRARLPAIFADNAHASRSDRYTYVSTIDLLRGLAKEGFKPTYAIQANTRKEDMRGHTKHLIRLRRDFTVAKPDVAEIVMLNSHGGQSSAQLFGGWFRFMCMNGMIVGDTLDEVRVHHKGDIVSDVVEGAYTIADRLGEVGDSVDRMKAIALPAPEQIALADAALTVRFDLAPGEKAPLHAEQLLRARRYDDNGADLWSTFNRVQENVMKGGLHGVTRDANNRRRNMTTREIRGIDQNVSLNRALWTLAQTMADLKGDKPLSAPAIKDAEFREVE
jgi:hypothetical protein